MPKEGHLDLSVRKPMSNPLPTVGQGCALEETVLCSEVSFRAILLALTSYKVVTVERVSSACLGSQLLERQRGRA